MQIDETHDLIDEKTLEQSHRRRRTFRGAVTVVLGLTVALATAVPTDQALFAADVPALDGDFAELEDRLDVLDDGLSRVSEIYERDVKPVEDVLSFYSVDDTLVRRIAVALVREGRDVKVDPRVLTSVLLVENPWLNPSATSHAGAVGLMQVMPFHAGGWGCKGTDLTDLDVNICHGARVFENALNRSNGNLDRALLRYNGCVRGTTTPDCHLYPTKVYAAAGKALVRGWVEGPTS